MPFLGTTPTQGFVSSFPKQSFTPNGSTTVFTLTNPVANANDLEVFVGNVRQEPTAAYTAAGTTLTMSEAPASGLNFYVINKSFAQVTTNPPDGSVSSAKLASTLDLSGTGRTGHGGFKSIQVFTSTGSSTYTKPAGVNTVKVICTGGGGGGGAGAANWNTGGGGHAGGTAIDVVDISGVSTVAVTVGIGGAGGNGGTGNSGGTSSFGSYCSATGGEGGISGGSGNNPTNFGGTATGGLINIRGGAGQSSSGGDANDEPVAGHGGASFWGDGSSQGATNAGGAYVDGFAGVVYGAGGGGGDHHTSHGARQGGAGMSGIVVVEEYA